MPVRNADITAIFEEIASRLEQEDVLNTRPRALRCGEIHLFYFAHLCAGRATGHAVE
ncbi:MAG TPA: hypothetical protein VMV97_05160 [Sulfuriferula sp.]|nr:hypothetical protein [Sulfuriferula sp.]